MVELHIKKSTIVVLVFAANFYEYETFQAKNLALRTFSLKLVLKVKITKKVHWASKL